MTARGLLVAALVVALGGGPATAAAPAAPPRCAVVDVGAIPASAVVREAVEKALAGAKKFQPLPDAGVRAALRGEAPASQRVDPARAALAAAARAYGALECDAAQKHAGKAFDLLEPEVTEPGVRDDVRKALVYGLLCADARGDREGGAILAALLRGLVAAPGAPAPAEPPPGVSREVWQKYPAPPVTERHTIDVRSEPAGARVLIDLWPLGTTPLTVAVPAGRHRLTVARSGYEPWREVIDVTKAGTAYEAKLKAYPLDRFGALRAQVLGVAKRPQGERAGIAARLGREVGAARVLAFEVHKGRLRAELLDAASAQVRGALFEADAQKVAAHPADLTAFLDGADAVPARAPASRPAGHAKLGSRWWHWVIAAGVVALLGVAIWQSEKSSDSVTIRVTRP